MEFYTNTQIARIREMAAEGASSKTIGRELGRAHSGIQKLCQRMKIQLKRPDQLTRNEVVKIYEMHMKGVPREQIALEFGITATKVRETAHREHKRRKAQESNPELNPHMSKLLSIRWVPEEPEEEW